MPISIARIKILFSRPLLSRTASTASSALVNRQRTPAAAPRLASATEELPTDLKDVVNYCSSHLGLQGLACLAASSKQLKKACHQTATSDAALLLVHAVDAAAKDERLSHAVNVTMHKKGQQHIQAVAWLLHVAPKAATAAKAAEQLVRLPSVPLHVAGQFVKAGLRISFAQLQAAANSMVPGVEVWMEAQQQLGVATDIPRAVVALCCTEAASETGYWSKLWKKRLPHVHAAEQLSKADVPGLLQLGTNSSSGETALAAVRLLEPLGFLAEGAASSSQAGIVRRLLVTAAVRQHQLALLHMAAQQEILQLIDAATLQQVLQQLIAAGDTTCVDVLLGKLQPAAAQQLSSEALAQLLQAAVDKDSCAATEQLCKLPAAQQLNAGAVVQLLEAAWKQDNHTCAAHLFELPEVRQFDAGTVARLAEVTLQQNNGPYTTRLLTLPAAKELTIDMVTQLLGVAIQQSDEVYVWRLYCTPAVLQLSSRAVVELLHAAISQGQCAIDHIANLSKLPAAEHISKLEAEQLLQAAEDNMVNSGCKMRLWQIPAVAGLMQVRLEAIKARRQLWGLHAGTLNDTTLS